MFNVSSTKQNDSFLQKRQYGTFYLRNHDDMLYIRNKETKGQCLTRKHISNLKIKVFYPRKQRFSNVSSR